jgi:hypothetical protein
MEELLTVLRRDHKARRILIECPRCRWSIPLAAVSITELEAGSSVLSWCRGCTNATRVTVAALGGSLWEPPG